MGATTISVSERVRKELLRLAANLQARSGEKVHYDQVIQYLLSKTGRSEQLLRQACAPVGVAVADARKELRRGRIEDRGREEDLETRYV